MGPPSEPGENKVSGAVVNSMGGIVTDPAAVAEVLRHHCEDTSVQRPVDSECRQRWMEALAEILDTTSFDTNAAAWTVRKKDVAWAVKRARISAPGPDEIPSAACRHLGRVRVSALFEVARDVELPDFPFGARRHTKTVRRPDATLTWAC